MDGLDPTDPSFDKNNECYECMIEEFGPNGKPETITYNDCIMRGVDSGYSALEDYCLHYCAMPKCVDKCHVHHLDQKLIDDEGYERNNLSDTSNDPYNRQQTNAGLRSFDGVHMDVADYMDPTMLPGYDPHTKKYYVTSVFYHKTDTSEELKSDGRCDMDHIYYTKPPNKAPEKDPVQTMLEGHWLYVGLVPVSEAAVEPNVLGKGTLTISNVTLEKDSGHYKMNNLTLDGVGCHLSGDGVARAGSDDRWILSYRLKNTHCSGVEGNVWDYAYTAHYGDRKKMLQEHGIENFKQINVAHEFMTGTAVRVKSHFTDKDAGPYPFVAGGGFTEKTTLAGRMSGAYGAPNLHLEGEAAAFSLAKL